MSSSPGPTPPRPSVDARAVLGLAAVAALLFGGALRGLTFATGDLQPLFLGQLDSFVASVARGSWPVWDPLFGFGQPLWANPGNQILYPPTWLNLLVLPETYLTLYVVGHALGAGVGTWALGRRVLGLSPWAAWVAAAGWMTSGPLLSMVPRWQHFASAAWLPWVILAAHRCVARPTGGRVLALAFALSFQGLAGSLEVAAATLVVAAVWSAVGGWPTAGLRAVRVWIPAGLVAVGLTAALWIPALELLRHSARADLAGTCQTCWSIHPWRWFEVLAPLRPDEMLLRPELRASLLGPTGTTIVPSLYLGAVMGGLVLYALLASPRRRPTAGLAALAAVSALVAMGPHLPLVAWIAEHLPPFSILRFPGKLTLLVSFAWALLAGLGVDAWRARVAAAPRAAGVLSLTALGAGLPAFIFALLAIVFPGVLVGRIVPPPPPGARVWDALSLDVLLCVAAVTAASLSAALAWSAGRRPRWTAVLAAAISLLAVSDLVLPNHRLNPTVRSELVGRPPETAQRLHADGATRIHVIENEPQESDASGRPRPGRFDLDPRAPLDPREALALGENIALAGRSASRWGLAGSFTLESLVVPSHEQLTLSELFHSIAERPPAVRLLQAGAVSHVVARTVVPGGLEPLGEVPSPLLAPVRLARVPAPLPRSYVVGRARVGSDEDALRFLLDVNADLRGTVVLVDGRGITGPSGFTGTTREARRRPDEVVLEVEASTAAYLVLVEAYDPGWTARVDDRPARVHRANFAFRAVAVPEGRHEVQLRYRPRGVVLGSVASGVTLAAVLLGWAWRRVSDLRSTARQGASSPRPQGRRRGAGLLRP